MKEEEVNEVMGMELCPTLAKMCTEATKGSKLAKDLVG